MLSKWRFISLLLFISVDLTACKESFRLNEKSTGSAQGVDDKLHRNWSTLTPMPALTPISVPAPTPAATIQKPDQSLANDIHLQTCSFDSAQFCANVTTAGLLTREISLGANTSAMDFPMFPWRAPIKVIGNHTGTNFPEVAILHHVNGQPAMSIVNLDAGSVFAQVVAPSGIRTSYSEFPAGPQVKLYPWFGPAYGDTNENSVFNNFSIPWGYGCLFRPGTIANGRCPANFMEVSTVPQHGQFYFREVGGYLQDLDRDGWEDINLIYHYQVLAISTRTAQRLNDVYYDVASITEPNAVPTGFHDGRNYGIHSAYTAANGNPRTVEIGGVPVGTFNDVSCNVSRFVTVLQGVGGKRSMLWANYYGFESNSFSSIDATLASKPPLSRPADWMNGCIHHFHDGRTIADGKNAIVFNVFSSPKIIRCVVEQYALYLRPQWTNAKNIVWENCRAPSLKDTGTWSTRMLDENTGSTIFNSPNTYVWGQSNQLTPDRATVYIVETVRSSVAADFSNQSIGQLQVRGIKNGAWETHGTIPVVGRPEVPTSMDDSQIIEGSRGIGSYTYFSELNLADRDGDGIMECLMINSRGQQVWVGYDGATGTFKVK